VTTYRTIPDGAMFVRPDTARPEVVYVRRDARNYHERDGAEWCYGVGPADPPIACKADLVTVSTWADGYGNWHAKVAGPDIEAFHALTAHNLALSAVRSELAERAGPGFDATTVGVVRESLDRLPRGRVAIQYVEVPA